MASRTRTVAEMVAASGLQAACYALAALLATRWLPIDQRGAMVVALTIASLSSLALTLGTGIALRADASIEPARRSIRSTYSWTSIALGCLAALVAVAAAEVFGRLSHVTAWSVRLSLATGLMALVMAVQWQLTEALFADGRFRSATFWAAAAAAGGLLGLCAAGVAGSGAATMVAAQALGTGVLVGLTVVYATRWQSIGWDRFSFRHGRSLVRVGLPSLGWTLGLALVLRVDRIVLATAASVSAVAVYALAATLGESLRLVPTAISQLLTRAVVAGARWPQVERRVWQTTVLTVLLAVPLLLSSWLLIGPVFGAEYAAATPVLGCLLIGEVGYTIFMVASRAMLGLGDTKLTGGIGLAVSVVAIPVYYWASRSWGMFGCAVASTAIYSLMGAAALVFARARLVAATSPERAGPVSGG